MQLLLRKVCILLFTSIFFFKPALAGDTTGTPLRVAVLIPLYLDSAFSGYEYSLSTTKIPQFFLSGLEFYNGVMMAVDSLQKEGANVEVWIYDTRKSGENIQATIDELLPMKFSLIIASLSTSAEQKAVSEFSAKNNIPVISATFPNDVYLNYNPYFIMVNPTWKTHVQAVYQFLYKNYKGRKILFLTRKGSLEDKIIQELQAMNADHGLILTTVVLDDEFSDYQVLARLDSTRQNIIVCGSLNENFGRTIIKVLNTNADVYSSVVVGMPTWNGMSGTFGTASNRIEIVITTPYNYRRDKMMLASLSEDYKASYFARPSDMVFKGYEAMYHFTNLLLEYPQEFISKISDPAFKVANDYHFDAVRLSKTSFVPDYLENKKIYFIRIVNGEVQSIE